MPKRRPIFVIDPALHTCELDCFNQCVRRAPTSTDFRYFAPAKYGYEDLLATDERPCGLLILGSGASVYDAKPWQKQLHPWLLERMLDGVPTFGICYGHQLIAHLFGGKISLGFNGDKVRGCRKIDLAASCRLKVAKNSGSTIISHREVVTDPGCLDVIASSQKVKIEGVQHPNLPIWGFQPHLEATSAFLRNNNIPLTDREHHGEFGYSLINAFVVQAVHKNT